VKPDKKQTIINAVFDKVLSELSSNFVSIIVKKKREAFLEEIANQFIQQYLVHKNVQVAKVTTAIPLNDKLRKEMPRLVQEIMKSDATVELIEEVDEELLGGLVLRVGDQQLDDSIRKKLSALEMDFSQNPYVKKF
jgi:F-type H+-transporting ATPase subunit delta